MYPKLYEHKSYVINTAIFLQNRCPSKANDNKILYELSNRKSNVKFLKIFSSQTCMFLKKGLSISKFNPKGEKTILVGYSSEAKRPIHYKSP